MYNPRSVIQLLVVTSLILIQVTRQEAKADPENSSGTWIASISNFRLSDRLRAMTMLQPRLAFDDAKTKTDGEIRQFLAIGAIGYELLPKVTFFQGYGVLPQYEPTRLEHRIFQDLIVGRSLNSWKFVERYRLEQRLLEGISGVSWRGRILERLQHPVTGGLSGVVSEELIVTLNNTETTAPQRGFDQNRFFLGVNFAFSDNLSADFGYMNQFIDRPKGRDNLSNHLLSITLFSSFDIS